GLFVYWLTTQAQRTFEPIQLIILIFACTLGVFVMLMVIGMRMPTVQARTRADLCNKYLLYALKDMVVQVNSGATVYDAIKSVSEAHYEQVSPVFYRIVQLVEVGVPLKEALDMVSVENSSEYLQKTVWQIKSSLRTGSDLSINLQNLI